MKNKKCMCLLRNLLCPEMQSKCGILGLKRNWFGISLLSATDTIQKNHQWHHTIFTHGMMVSKVAMDKD